MQGYGPTMKIYFDDGAPASAPAFTYLKGQSPAEPEATKPARRTRREKADINKVWSAVTDHMVDDALRNVPGDVLNSRPRAEVRNWQVAVIYAMIHTGIVTTVVMLATGDEKLGLFSLAFHGTALFFGLCVGLMFRRL